MGWVEVSEARAFTYRKPLVDLLVIVTQEDAASIEARPEAHRIDLG